MPKTILMTGATAGIGRLAATQLVTRGHDVLLHGRNQAKLDALAKELAEIPNGGAVSTYVADLSRLADVALLARAIQNDHERIDVLINNAGVYRAAVTETADGLDVRFAVNTIAPFLLTRELLSRIPKSGRVINLSSAAQSPVSLDALISAPSLTEHAAYAQSKLAITMWSRQLALSLTDGPAVVSLNPGSMLGTKMVKDAFGVAGKDIRIGADIITRCALDDTFQEATGRYFDNDLGRFGPPHPDAMNEAKCDELLATMEGLLRRYAD